MLLINQTRLITISIYYYMPDYPSIVQEFVWQLEDIVPNIPRTHKFLNHWHHNIEATIQQILLCGMDQSGPRTFRSVDEVLNIN